jgi:hypothetical protein
LLLLTFKNQFPSALGLPGGHDDTELPKGAAAKASESFFISLRAFFALSIRTLSQNLNRKMLL